ncbi:MAG: NAD(P)-binding domain-containing protein, partial [Gammaproteobacteria bacterium]|nr:NAD(P)-binding domain-containing protein [Gammaproteobacteria bacterium]
MTNRLLGLGVYAAPMVLIWFWYALRRQKTHRETLVVRGESIEAGLTEPASLHPVIDPVKCIGCGSCIAVCPEMPGHKVLGLVHGKAEIVSPTDRIGHGACQAVCPEDAIMLVFGTERRGVDIPNVKPNLETNVPGIFIAGELGGMGLIRKAVEQGRQAIDSIADELRKKRSGATSEAVVDVIIVGAGPAGFSASLAAREKGLSVRTIEQDSLGGTVANFPRGKLVMTAPAMLPMVGLIKFSETTKEKLLSFWTKVERDTGVEISYGERLESLSRDGDVFRVTTTTDRYAARAILLAVGRRGTPRKLSVPGEELPKVTYRLIDPEQYRGQRVLVVGGGDSALEAATTIAEEAGTEVTLSCR